MADPQPYRSDAPPSLSDETDSFGHSDYAKTLCRVVHKVPTPFTLGLFAPWGTGKSAILGAAASHINEANEEQTNAAVVIDVWKYEDTSLRREFVRDLGEGLKKLHQLKATFDLDKHLARLDADEVGFRASLKFDWRQFLVALAIAILVGLGIYFLLGDQDTKQLGKAAFSGLVLLAVTSLIQSVRVREVQITRKQLKDADEFTRVFEGLLNKGLKCDRLVVAIDNLDRCSPERVTELLSTIKTFLEPAKTSKELVLLSQLTMGRCVVT